MQKNKNAWLWALPVLWMCVIFAFSHQPGQDSSQLSGQITSCLSSVLSMLGLDFSGMDLNLFIRKAAHFSLYFVLGILIFTAHYANRRIAVESAVVAVLISIGYAISDEYHQYFVPGRSCQLRDVLIDSSGAFSASAVCMAVRILKTRIYRYN